ncbi:helix-turn-helix domain-containing protein [Paraconexibacter antarcticus]|uniref:Helix-turn-helix domain-containing protein n=1 Tax=Paraconexibacter antarcticus TaxID=2949664 RepID=A0ABY5DS61_9ACTN|nr:helix-turn-helix domain-containing protein [Paraconexibacter antarcticus]UTI63922.1 helix-turn-helix domain-containing protein [Paraconexibacter antarcticus]
MTAAEGRTMNVTITDELVEEIAQRAASILTEQRAQANPETDAEPVDGYLPPTRAAAYLGISRQRIYQLTSGRALCPDGRDGRTPLYTRRTLDRYVRQCAGRER